MYMKGPTGRFSNSEVITNIKSNYLFSTGSQIKVKVIYLGIFENLFTKGIHKRHITSSKAVTNVKINYFFFKNRSKVMVIIIF